MGVKVFSSLLMIAIILSLSAFANNDTVEETKVIIKFKDPSTIKYLSVDDQESLEMKIEEINEFRDDILEKLDLDIEHEYNLTNSVVAYVDEAELKELKKSRYVEGIYEDFPVHTFLDTSNNIIGSDSFVNLSIQGIKVNGSGETVCIIDTGIDYTHPAFGSCVVFNETRTGNNVSHANQSMHPYTNNLNQYFRINKTGFRKISIHFVNISIEPEWDMIKILDSQNNTVAMYTGDMEDFWTPSVDGDTIYVKLETDDIVTGWGFKIDQVINGTVNTTMNWTTCEKVAGGWDLTGYNTFQDDQDPRDDNNHGTHVSGIIASMNSTYRGVAPGARIFSVKALNEDGAGNTTDVLAAMEFCIENKQRFNISVISMSLGSGSYNDDCDFDNGIFELFSSVVGDAISQGIMVVAASGNAGSFTGIAFPACLQNVTSVGATNKADSIDTGYSNSNAYLDLLATGTSIISSQSGGGFVSSTGTSMAAPHVSGAALLLRNFKRLENGSILTPLYIEYVLKTSGNNKTDSRNSIKTERINLTSALAMIDDIPRLTFTDITTGNTSMNFSNINITATEPVDAVLYFDNISYTMIGSNREFYFRINLTETHNFTVIINDSTGNLAEYGSYFISFDQELPTVNISYPVNNSVINKSHGINITIDASENTECIFITNESKSIVNYANFSIYENGLKNLTVNCTDLSDNTVSSTIFFTINDTESPAVSSLSVTSTASTISFSFTTDEPSNATALVKNSTFSKTHSFTKSGLTSSTTYLYNLTICDRIGNCNTTSGSKSTAASGGSGGGGGGGGSSSGSGAGYTRIVKQSTIEFGETGFIKTDYPGKIIFRKAELPSYIPNPGISYQILEILVNESRPTKLNFKVEKKWIDENSITEISLFRYSSDWEKLQTILSSSDEEFNYYNATTPGFSYFAIVGEKAKVMKNETFRLEINEEPLPEQQITEKPLQERNKNYLPILAFLMFLGTISVAIVGNKK